MAKSNFFRAFVEGNTISDGRTITAEMIDEIVETFNTETYTPRINVEHIAGYSPEPPFNGYGSVVAVKAQDDDITIAGKTEKRRALYVQVEGNKQLVKLAKDDQKPFPSVELTPSYSGCGKTGLIGLAFTDTPASIATQSPKFSRSAPGTLFAAGADAITFQFEDEAPDATGVADAIKAGFASLAAKFTGTAQKAEPQTPPTPANDNDLSAFATAIGDQVTKAITDYAARNDAAVKKIGDDLATLTGKLENTESPAFKRQAATGASPGNAVATDC